MLLIRIVLWEQNTEGLSAGYQYAGLQNDRWHTLPGQFFAGILSGIIARLSDHSIRSGSTADRHRADLHHASLAARQSVHHPGSARSS